MPHYRYRLIAVSIILFYTVSEQVEVKAQALIGCAYRGASLHNVNPLVFPAALYAGFHYALNIIAVGKVA